MHVCSWWSFSYSLTDLCQISATEPFGDLGYVHQIHILYREHSSIYRSIPLSQLFMETATCVRHYIREHTYDRVITGASPTGIWKLFPCIHLVNIPYIPLKEATCE